LMCIKQRPKIKSLSFSDMLLKTVSGITIVLEYVLTNTSSKWTGRKNLDFNLILSVLLICNFVESSFMCACLFV